TCQSALNTAAGTSDNALILNTNDVDCRVTVGGRTYGFRYNNGTFETFGNINIRGLTLQFEKDTVYTALSRSSTGALQDFGALSLESYGSDGGDFIAKGDFVTASSQKFPENVLTVVAEQDVKLLGKNGNAR